MASQPSIAALAFLVVVVLIGGGAAGAYLFVHNRPSAASTPFLAYQGDNVTVNYVGIFGSGPEEGKVFDTSLYSAAQNDAAYPKALQYHARGVAGNYSPLAVHIGPSTPSSGYSYAGKSFIQVVTGFWQGLVGLPGNTTRLVVVPPPLGYGPVNTACVRTLPLTFTVPVIVTMAGAVFAKRYPGILATTGASFANTTYGWTVLILSANATSVTVENLATIGEISNPFGWTVEVTNVVASPKGIGTITVTNELTAAGAGHVPGHDANGLCTSNSHGSFIVTAVDLTNGTYTENFNQEVQGQTLIFQVSIVNIYHPPGLATQPTRTY